MDYLEAFDKYVHNDGIRNEIAEQINNIQDLFDWDTLNLDIGQGDVEVSQDDLAQHIQLWEDIAKLSIDLFRDYSYYSRFAYESESHNRLQDNLLTKLGFERNGNLWKCKRRPHIDDVLTNVIVHYIHRMACNSALQKNDANEWTAIVMENSLKLTNDKSGSNTSKGSNYGDNTKSRRSSSLMKGGSKNNSTECEKPTMERCTWKCWRKSCLMENDIDKQYCTKCGLDKGSGCGRGDIVKVKKGTKIAYGWLCNGCGDLVQSTDRAKCNRCWGSRHGSTNDPKSLK